MATFLKWKELHDKGELKRAYVLAGPDRVLVEEVIDGIRYAVQPSDLDYISLNAGSVKDAEIWDALNQYPSTDSARKLVLVRDAEKIRNWKPLEPWFLARAMPHVYVVFVTSMQDFPCKCKHAHNRHKRKEADKGCRDCACQGYDQPDWLARIVKTGRSVKCGPLNDEDFVSYLQLIGPIDRVTGRYLRMRVGNNLALAVNCMRKAKYFKVEIDERIVNALTVPSPAESFVAELLRFRKHRAVDAIWAIPEDDYSRIIGALDHDLEVLAKLHRLQTRRMNTYELQNESKEHRVVVERLQPAAKHYDPSRVRSCVQTLAFVDSMRGRGVREGLLETLVALW